MDVYDAWNGAVEEIKRKVTGVGVWTALNCAVPIVYEEGYFVLGFGPRDVDLMGHLKPAGVQRTIEVELESRLNGSVKLELLSGITINDWQGHKRRLEEAKKLKSAAASREKQVREAGRAWDEVYERAGRAALKYNAKGRPHQAARLLEECVEDCAQHLPTEEMDEDEERAFARATERIGQLCDVPPTTVAYMVLSRSGRL